MESKVNDRLPKVSILVTTYNCRENFKKSIQSILEQDYQNLEVVICDGASTDGTIDEIKKAALTAGEKGKTVIWKSEKDKGIYDGLNKGISMASGEIIAVCNDLFTTSHAVSRYVEKLMDSGCDGVHSDLVYLDGQRCVRYWKMGQGNIHFGWMPAHPTMYLKKDVYDKYGNYDLRYHSSSDYDFMLRILRDKKIRFAYIPEVMISMFYGGTSNGGGGIGYWENIKEAWLALIHNKISFPATALFLRIIRTSFQFVHADRKWKKSQKTNESKYL